MHVCYLCFVYTGIKYSGEQDFDTGIHEDINCSCKYGGMYVCMYSFLVMP